MKRYNRYNYHPLRYTPKQVRALAKAWDFKIKWYEYIFNGLLRKRLLNYFQG